MKLKTFPVTPVMDTAIYANNELAWIPIRVPNFFLSPLDSVCLQSVAILDKAVQSVAIDLIFLNKNVSMGTLNGAFAPADADAESIVGQQAVAAADYRSYVNSSYAQLGNLWKVLTGGGVDNDLWLAGAIRSGTPTYAAGSLVIQLGVERP